MLSLQISEKDVRIVKVLGRGASSVVSRSCLSPMTEHAVRSHCAMCAHACKAGPAYQCCGACQSGTCSLRAEACACAGLQGVPGALRQVRRHQEDQLLRAGACSTSPLAFA